jgi:alkylation response protein AidB-like acyl-CoA dehydrogenase
MDFYLSKKQRAIRNMTRTFAREVVAPRAEEIERTGEHPYDIVAQMAELGMMGIPFPKKYGGSAGDWVGLHLCIEELSRADILLGIILDASSSIVAQEVFLFGTEEQKQRWLIPLAQGKELGAYGLTEPEAGSDSAGLSTTAVLKSDEWIINGSKQFITNTNLDNSSIVIITAKTQRESDGKTVISTIVVPKDASGFKVGQKNNVAESREKIGNDPLLLGNFDPYGPMVQMAASQVEQVIKKCIDDGVDAIWPGCDFWPEVKKDNMEALMAATQKYGKLR